MVGAKPFLDSLEIVVGNIHESILRVTTSPDGKFIWWKILNKLLFDPKFEFGFSHCPSPSFTDEIFFSI